MHWSTVLYNAAEQFDGGARSFPLSSEAGVASKYRYELPNEEYEKLFLLCKAATSRSQDSEPISPYSAGWLIPNPDDDIVCKPIFIAHSALAATWLLREMLPSDALPNDSWERLVCAVQSLAEDSNNSIVEPPSAQKHPNSPVLERSKRPAPSTLVLSPKRTCLETLETPAASPQPSEPLVEEQRTITTVTNHNRRAEQKRIKEHEAAVARHSVELGLVAPDRQATDSERGAYASIPLKDKEVISWIIKQPATNADKQTLDFYNAVKTPYLRARDFLAKARALGNPLSQEHAAQFLQVWRQRGTLFSGGVAARYNTPLSQQQRLRAVVARSSQQNSTDQLFCSAWERCDLYDEVMKSVHIEYRWAQALLGQALANKVAQIKHNDSISSNNKSANRYGKGFVRSEAIDSLMQLVNPNAYPTKKERDVFRARLAKASKWYEIAESLGWGVFLVMPEDSISKTWIEHTVRAWGLQVFIRLVRRERPDVCLAARQFDTWLGLEGIAGGAIGGKKTLGIELDVPEVACEVQEINDSEDEADDRVEIVQPPIRLNSRVPAASLRQTTLPELFKAVA